MVGHFPQKVLVTGSHGQLGRSLDAACVNLGIEVEGRDMDTLDIRDAGAVEHWIRSARPTVVVNAAAVTAVDDCESDEAAAMAINGEAVGNLAQACNAVDAHLIQISTDYVFSGDADRPYLEDDAVDPKTAYGRSKLLGEELARGATRHLILRTAWLYGHGGRNFVETIRGLIASGRESLEVVDDQQGCPTFCDDLSLVMLELAGSGATGVMHAVNSGHTSWHGFATEIARLLDVSIPILPVSTAEFSRPAPRPAYSVLDISRLEAAVSRPMPHWRDGLQRYMEEPCES